MEKYGTIKNPVEVGSFQAGRGDTIEGEASMACCTHRVSKAYCECQALLGESREGLFLWRAIEKQSA